MQSKLKGTGVALITPFFENLEIDYNSFEKLLKFHSENGVDYFVVNGTTGESATTNKSEKHKLLKHVIDHNPKGLPIVYGTGGYDTQDIIDHVKEMDWNGVDALLSVSPYYNRPSQKGIIEHYKAIADVCPAPIILYNVPKRTGSNMKAETTLALAEHPNIVGIKEASGDFGQITDIMAHKPDDFLMISGDDMATVPMISIGASGVISVMANAFPKMMSDMVRHALSGDYASAQKLLFELNEINPLMYKESSPVGVKETLALMGYVENHVRLPLVKGSDGLRKKISAFLNR